MVAVAGLSPVEELQLLLRPAGGGIHLVSTGRAAQVALQQRLYGVDSTEAVEHAFRESFARLSTAKAFVLGIPSDVGAGFRRGANLGPAALREGLLRESVLSSELVDVGDVFVVPQLLHDTMLSTEQLCATRASLYPALSLAQQATMPVAPLSIAARALELLAQINPNAKPLVLGGDHACTWPVVESLHSRTKRPWAIVQVDAHTDLLEHRLGVRYCFATWSYHANDLLGRQGRLVQFGIRASGRTQAHWESQLGVKQFWAEACNHAPEGVLRELVTWLKQRGIEAVYFSNDLDGTDERYAAATGTPEPQGLEPPFVEALIDTLGSEFELLGADLMEFAPALEAPNRAGQSLDTCMRYLRRCCRFLCGH